MLYRMRPSLMQWHARKYKTGFDWKAHPFRLFAAGLVSMHLTLHALKKRDCSLPRNQPRSVRWHQSLPISAHFVSLQIAQRLKWNGTKMLQDSDRSARATLTVFQNPSLRVLRSLHKRETSVPHVMRERKGAPSSVLAPAHQCGAFKSLGAQAGQEQDSWPFLCVRLCAFYARTGWQMRVKAGNWAR